MTDRGSSLGTSRRKFWRAAVFAAIAVFFWAIPNARPDFTRFNSHDSENYLALSYSLTHGHGYTRSLPPARYVSHEMWPPGWPVLLGAATVGSDEVLDWRRVKRTIATLGLLGLFPAWFWVRRVAGEGAADAATLALALHPLYWHFSHQAMAELPLFLWLLFGLFWMDRIWSRDRVGAREAVLTGLVCGLGMLIKGHAAALAVVPLAYLGAGAAGQSVRARGARWGVFCLAFALPFALWIARNQTVEAAGPDGFSQLQQMRIVDPMDPGSAVRDRGQAAGAILRTLRHHAIYHLPSTVVPGLWPEPAFDWPGSGWLALALSLLLIATAFGPWPAPSAQGRAAPGETSGRRGALLVVGFLSMLNLSYGYGGAVRFWLPVGLLMLLLVAARLSTVLTSLPSIGRRLAGAAATVTLVANLAVYVGAHERAPYNPSGPWAELADLFEAVRSEPFETSGVLTPNPQAFQLVSGLPAPMAVAGARFQHLVARTDGKGPQPPEGSRLVIERSPWALWELPEPTSGLDPTTDGPVRYPMKW